MTIDKSAASNAARIDIDREPVELYKILKFEGLADSGAQAKQMINAGLVVVNGAVETRKRKKILSGDTIEFEGESYLVCRDDVPTGSDLHENQ